jgi:hypothetical protein
MMSKKQKIAVLTPDEKKALELAIQFHGNTDKGIIAADRAAWRDVCREFPRLKKFDGGR